MLVSDFDFDLPEHLIAQEAAPRGTSRLLVLDRATGGLHHGHIGDLPQHLRAGDLLVVNNTRVFAARLLGHRVPSGGAVECLLLGRLPEGAGGAERAEGAERAGRAERAGAGAGARAGAGAGAGAGARAGARAMGGGEPGALYSALMHPGQKLKAGARVRFDGPSGVLMAEVLERHFYGRRTIRLWTESGGDIDDLIDGLGHVPLPPYIRRPDSAADRERYQTVFASVRGSVAAPTAGLHFTRELLARIDAAGVARTEITLHVGYGTFKPVRSETVEEHVVDPEEYYIADEAARSINRALGAGRRVIAVGTTTTRALEDAALRGGGRVAAGPAAASIFIYPGFAFRIVGGLVTNFHLPRSSLLMLAAAFAGRERILDAYRVAVAERYRFYSYGDAMFIA